MNQFPETFRTVTFPPHPRPSPYPPPKLLDPFINIGVVTLPIVSHLIPGLIEKAEQSPHFTDEETEVQSGRMLCPKSQQLGKDTMGRVLNQVSVFKKSRSCSLT